MSEPHRQLPEISLVVPMYNEAEGVDLFFDRVVPVLNSVSERWEILCINDGSKDATLPLLKGYAEQDPRIRYLSLSRNFGKEAALTAGLHYTRGRAVIPIDADMQDPPELIPEMVAKWQEGYKVVLATRRTRDGDGWFKRATAGLFYKLMKRLIVFELPENTGDFRLMDSSVVDVVRRLPERTRFMKGIFAWVGFSSARVYYDRPERAAGRPKQNYYRLWQLAKDGIFSFTTLPLRVTTYIGLTISLFAFCYGLFLILRTLIYGVELEGYASMMTTILFLGGIQLLSLGIIGEYLGRIYRESKQRPLFVIEEMSSR